MHFFGFSPWKRVKQVATSFIKVEAITSLDGVENFFGFYPWKRAKQADTSLRQ